MEHTSLGLVADITLRTAASSGSATLFHDGIYPLAGGAGRWTIIAEELASGGNMLLAALAHEDLSLIAPHARRVDVCRGHVLQVAHEMVESVLFPESGVASVIKNDTRTNRTEIHLIGTEGFVGSALLLADGSWPYETFVQSERLTAIQIDGAPFASHVWASATMRRLLLRMVQAQMVQIAEGLVSAVWQKVPARLARWLLMYRDRSVSDRLEITPSFIAMMIGVQRTGITAALHDLEGRGLLVNRRGLITLRDVAGLRQVADGSYGDYEREQDRLIGS